MTTTSALTAPGTSGADPGASAKIAVTKTKLPGPLTFIIRVIATLWSNTKSRIGLILFTLIILIALFSPLIVPYSPKVTSFAPYAPSSGAHWLGTTGNGEDVLSQLLYGSRISLLVGLTAGLIGTFVAVSVGLLSGYRPGMVDNVISFVVNLALLIPGIPLMIVMAAYLPRGLLVIIFVSVITGWAYGARVIRSQTSALRSRDFVTAAALSGDSTARIIFREIMPNMTSLVAGSFFGAAIGAVLGEASLEFLGLGDLSTVSWGTMLYWAQNSGAILTGRWVVVLAPGLAIALLMAAFTLINFGVDALSNPRLREKA
ncbi:MAG: ABC transporter permease [Actinomycetota bacterium]|nr:ABC transporter permease [Actinomycetota bacterium]